MKYVSKHGDVPQTRHWAILKFSSIHIPEDERSRTHPGHGYPAEDRPIVMYEAYTDHHEWEKAVTDLETNARGRETYVAMEVNPAKITLTATVKVSTT
jgi:hypothetical protein